MTAIDWKSIVGVTLFVAGFLCHVLKVANDDVQKTLFATKRAWLRVFYINVIVRLVIVVAAWILYSTTPDFFVSLLAKFGLNFDMALPVTKVTSFIVGFFSDSLLDLGTKKIPWLGREIPPAYIAPEVKKQVADQATTKKDGQ
jgi:hypothetical protein